MAFGGNHRVSQVSAKRAIACFAALTCALATQASLAGNVLVDTQVKETGVIDTNPLMLSQGAETITGSTTSPQIHVLDKTQASQIEVTAYIDASRFDRSSYNSTDIHTSTSAQTQNERWQLSFDQKVDYDTTRTSELSSYGVNVGQTRHTGLSFAPSLSYDITPTLQATISTTALTSRYDTSLYQNYNTFTVSPALTHAFDSLNTGMAQFTFQRYETTGTNYRNDSFGLQMGWQRKLSEKLSLRGNAGLMNAQESYQPYYDSKSSWSPVFSSSLAYKDEQDTVDLSATRQQYPQSNGSESLMLSIGANGTHKISPSWTVSGEASFRRSSYAEARAGDLKDMIFTKAGLVYHLTQDLSVESSYRYQDETLYATARDPKGSLYLLTLAYQNNGWHF